jgi:glutathione synthase/RimK-type ligase-like ATP-grasp enzyme
MSIAIVYERSETDEMGIKLAAEKLGIDLIHIPFRKISVAINEKGYSLRSIGKNYSKIIEDISVVLNRAQSKNRRLFASSILEAFGKRVINSSHVEFLCYSKLRTLLLFWKAGIKIPKTIYIPCDTLETTKNAEEIHNEKDIAGLIQQELGDRDIVVKPDAGTHGTGVRLAEGKEDLLTILRELKPSIINPLGVLAQELVQKWFYDLRIIVAKENGKLPNCYPTALARTSFKDFRTNAALGNMVFGVNLPQNVRDLAVKCCEILGEDSKAWVIALDAMVNVGEDKTVDDAHLKLKFEKIEPFFNAIKKVKADETKKTNFQGWNKKLEEAFQNYKNTEAYENIRGIIQQSIERNKHNVLFHEANSCPEFWEQTRLIGGINIAEPLLHCAQSLIES